MDQHAGLELVDVGGREEVPAHVGLGQTQRMVWPNPGMAASKPSSVRPTTCQAGLPCVNQIAPTWAARQSLCLSETRGSRHRFPLLRFIHERCRS